MAENIKYRFIQNVGEYFPSGYFGDDFIKKVQEKADISADRMKDLCKPYVALRGTYNEYKNYIINGNPRVKDAIKRTHDWHTALLRVLGYDVDHAYQEPYIIADGTDKSAAEMIPVRHILRSGDKVSMLIMEMQNLIPIDEQEQPGLFEQRYGEEDIRKSQRYTASQWSEVIPAQYLDREVYKFSPAIIHKAITQIFLMSEERRPRFVLMLAGNTAFLFDREKWARGSYLQFSFDDLFTQTQIAAYRNYFALFHLLAGKEALVADGQTVLMDTLIEDSYKKAYEVTKDLKEGVILAVETLANEALYYKNKNGQSFGAKQPDGTFDPTDDAFETEVKDECLTIVYRLLFILFAESRSELHILPTGDEVYKRGYSFDALRDLEQVRLISEESRNGYFFDTSIRHLFSILARGHRMADGVNCKSFQARPIDSPMFDDKRLHHLGDVKIRNSKWQEIIRALSLSRGGDRQQRGRISYANLGINQLGSVYESLLAYRGFYAEEDYIEVFKEGKQEEGTFLVPYSRMDAFKLTEVVCNEKGEPAILHKGTFVYRLNGRDRQKSASYYTPEVLTQSTIKYTIKAIVDDVREGRRKPSELLDLKILEPAVGAAAFLNEVINQLAEAYMQYTPKKPQPDHFRDELQKVKAYIATHNVYGVDLNPTAIELGKLSLWLNVIHKDMETPFFANRLGLGNAVIGAWLKVYSRKDVVSVYDYGKKKPREVKKWWETAPHKVKFYSTRVNRSVNDVYHFLLPDAGMLAARGIKELKTQYPAEAERMKSMLKDWTSPISANDFQTLQRLSAKIDVLLREAMETQVSIERITNNRADIWPHEGPGSSLFFGVEQAENYAEKERVFNTRYRRDNAYYKLRLVMDYWCALWFWELKDAASLPSRLEYWKEIENLLDVSDENLDRNTKRALEKDFSNDEEGTLDFGSEQMTEEEAQIITKSKEEILLGTKAGMSLFPDLEPERFEIVNRLRSRYHFFHSMLEFIEVFWLRDGFDIICGNPPWIKLQFDDKAVMSERFPEVSIHKVSAPDARAMKDTFMADPRLAEIYNGELMEVTCSGSFMNAYQNYPLLVGQQTNLYKCILENSFTLASDTGYIGLLTPESIYDDPNGQPLRRELYKRLRYHFQYNNELRLFAEVHHHTAYGDQLLGPRRSSSPRFASLSNLFHPATVDACFAHDGHGECGGIKDQNGNWNVAGHSHRIVNIGEDELRVLARTFESSDDWEATKLVSIHNRDIIDVLKKLSEFPTHTENKKYIVTQCIDETYGIDKEIIIRDTQYPNIDGYQMIYNGPQFHINNPLFKTPRTICVLNSDYDNIDLNQMDDDYICRSNYKPGIPVVEFKDTVKGFQEGQDENGEPIYGCWMDYYKLGFRKMLSQSGERTLICAVLQRRTAHINGVISVAFRDGYDTVDMAALCAALPLDFYMKTIGASNLMPKRIESFPLGVAERFNAPLRSRCMRLNCLTNRYAELWDECWMPEYTEQEWSIRDSRLKPWNTLTQTWNHDTPLRNYFERRQALVEIDVLAAMALGLTLDELIMMYEIQFPVLQQNENDTWYDRNGRIVFTCSKGLTGVGVDRKTWDAIKGRPLGDPRDPKAFANADPKSTAALNAGYERYEGVASTYGHTLTSELYAGRVITYEAPYNRCDRIADYRRAWSHFSHLLNK